LEAGVDGDPNEGEAKGPRLAFLFFPIAPVTAASLCDLSSDQTTDNTTFNKITPDNNDQRRSLSREEKRIMKLINGSSSPGSSPERQWERGKKLRSVRDGKTRKLRSFSRYVIVEFGPLTTKTGLTGI
jgi:cyclophilin family peptidyl-prolyl cis-trans isomerase